MKKVFAASVIATVLATSTAFAFEVPDTQPIKPIEGPGIRLTDDEHSTRPMKGIESPDIHLTGQHHPTQPVRGVEGPTIR